MILFFVFVSIKLIPPRKIVYKIPGFNLRHCCLFYACPFIFIRSLAFKWIRILFRCWKTHTPYDESTYLIALKSKGSPLLKFAVESEL
ncbi:hypothetical protein PTRA_a1983 [Pseudoalteromonas translucida KMM 520]|uniref:Uncharacterized protein n=1 Tax=Pseudoalteromonas translucida KMM 520 TaxID=1315283 RepID=A0A0U2V5C0_9GAMM|nr:hypothetical protein PTRA_a1983 [Pseudoalteromonas translucida KMM 520]